MTINKRGQTGEDTLYVFIWLFALVIAFLVLAYIYPKISEGFVSQPAINSSALAVQAINQGNTTVGMLDWFSLVLLIGFAIGFIVLGFFIDAHSVFMVIYILVMVVGVIICAALSWAFKAIYDTSLLSTVNIPITAHIMSYLAIYYTIISFIGLAVTFAKEKAQ